MIVMRLFGTNGVRGVVNEDLTVDLAVKLGKAIGSYFNGKVAIATDTRNSGGMIKSAVASGVMSLGADVIDLGVTPTPSLQYFVGTHDDVKGGVMITASHNPPQFNGIKCVGPTGRELIRIEEEKIEEFYSSDIKCKPWDSVGTISYDGSATESYVNAVVKQVDSEAIRKAGLTAVIDCVNGASCGSAPLLLSKLGVRAIALNTTPQGIPEHLSEPTEDNLKDLIEKTRSSKADIGVAHDGDADRAVFIDDRGNFISGDKSLSIMSKHVLSKKKGPVVTPVSSSSMVEDVVKQAGGTIMYTAVGSPTVAKAMLDNNAVFGGEENGGLIFPEHQLCRDGAMTVAKMLECIAKEGPLSEQVAKLPEYHVEKRKIDCPNECKCGLLDHLSTLSEGARTDHTDGLKMIYDDGWVLVRPSGTEPKFRIYSESKIKEVAARRADDTERIATEYMRNVSK